MPKMQFKKLYKLQIGKNIVRDVNSNLFPTNHEMDGKRSFICFFWNKVRILSPNRLGSSKDAFLEH
jgi:hypothetical protein